MFRSLRRAAPRRLLRRRPARVQRALPRAAAAPLSSGRDEDFEAFLRGENPSGPAAAAAAATATTGKVVDVSRGVCTVEGLAGASVGALVRFRGENGGGEEAVGVVMGLERDRVSVGMLDGAAERAGAEATLAGGGSTFPVGAPVRGRVLDGAGRPVDGGPPLGEGVARRKALSGAPNIVSRARVSELVRTGVLALDMFQPLGRGMRYALMGPPRSGKTDTALAVLEGQAERNREAPSPAGAPGAREAVTHLVYVACGKTRTEADRIVERLRECGALEWATVVVSLEGDPLALQYLAPFGGAAVADEVRDGGGHALVVYDDLTAHAGAHLHLARSLRHPIESLTQAHHRLLERSCRLTPGKGGGTSTALCLVDTAGEGLPFLVAENVGSAVDEALYLDADLAVAGAWPPVRSSSLVGKSFARFRPPVLRELMRRTHLRLVRSETAAADASFAADFGFEPEEETLPLVDHRVKVQQALFQTESAPLSGQIATVFALNSGVLYDVPERLVPDYLARLRAHLAATRAGLARELDSDRFMGLQSFPAAAAAELGALVREFHDLYAAEKRLVPR